MRGKRRWCGRDARNARWGVVDQLEGDFDEFNNAIDSNGFEGHDSVEMTQNYMKASTNSFSFRPERWSSLAEIAVQVTPLLCHDLFAVREVSGATLPLIGLGTSQEYEPK
ncbi:hypothetical protein Syun_012282 [Stephania yunnanensis]|uniref:Uncharacterized protein n=1 Tax=Stephania yunnanensis TaxID=152371 RepID=A0AAP0PG99_9MAGN